uniref:Armadillo-type protein n=2 Tax=Macrostomum lignano TaxID=282301 RepID=A0A1I8GFC6_9PLAT
FQLIVASEKMGSSKQEVATMNVMNMLREWDQSSKAKRSVILRDFINQHQKKSGPELEFELAQMASLFLARVSVWLKLTYMTGTCVTEQLETIHLFLSASTSHNFMIEFLEHGGIMCLLELLGLKKAKEEDKDWAIRILQCIANAGTKYKEIICESYGIRAVAECLAKSKSERTQDSARYLLQSLADGNARFVEQVYKGLIAVLPCTSPTAQQMAVQTLRFVQPIVKHANPVIVERLTNLLNTLHLEVQSATIEFIKELMHYNIADDLLQAVVTLLRPNRDTSRAEQSGGVGDAGDAGSTPMPIYVQQAAAAKCIGELARQSDRICDRLVYLRAVHHLMFAMGNLDHADSQRQASVALEFLCRKLPIVDEHVREAMGQALYDQFMSNAEALYVDMTPVQADVLVSNKVNIPAGAVAEDTEPLHQHQHPHSSTPSSR